MIQKLYHRFHKMLLIGAKATCAVLKNKIIKKRYEKKMRQQSSDSRAVYSWQQIANDHKMSYAIDIFVESFRLRSCFVEDQFFAINKDKNQLVLQADFFVRGGLNILGSGDQFFSKMPWHEDIRVKSRSFSSSCFFSEIAIAVGQTWQLEPDIKIPWEISRCHHVSYVAYVYAQTLDDRYAQYVIDTIIDWVEQNPYLYGVNWANPMEIAIRAINWIYALELCKHSLLLNIKQWEMITVSLYNHFVHLENTWEFYDGRTNNHYLADLVGYLYLCHFFRELPGIEKKAIWCIQELMKEFDKQVFQEGTSYEGSTAYHVLVTELFCHAFLLSRTFNYIWSENIQKKLLRMFTFIEWCTPHNGPLITLGDDDSGSVLFNSLSDTMRTYVKETMTIMCDTYQKESLKIYPQFGLSVIKTDSIHCSLRHQAYQPLQPSGHFHADALSVTLAINGQRIFADPGSYVYTASSHWRNYFRSMRVHNTFMLTHKEPFLLSNDLFVLPLPKKQLSIYSHKDVHELTMWSSHDWYAQYQLKAMRSIHCIQSKKIIIKDSWERIADNKNDNFIDTSWNFTLDPQIVVHQEQTKLVLLHNSVPLASLYSQEISFALQNSWVSDAYGIKSSTIALTARAAIQSNSIVTIHIDIF